MSASWETIEDVDGMELAVMRTIIECEMLVLPVTVGNVSEILRNRKMHVPASINQIEAWIAKYASTGAEKDTAC